MAYLTNGRFSFGNFTSRFIDAMAKQLSGKQVLEIFAGNGLLASELTKRGVSITATTLFSGHDRHEAGMHFDVLEMDAIEAVRTFKDDHDVLLMSWPTVTDSAAAAAVAWGPDKDIFYIGEMTDYSKHQLGGCATDIFFELTSIKNDLPGYETRNIMERAAILRASPDCASRFRTYLTRDRSGLHTGAFLKL